MDLDKIKSAIKYNKKIGKQIEYYEEIGSTHTYAKEIAVKSVENDKLL